LRQQPARQIGEDHGIGRARHQRADHVATGLAHDVGRDRGQLDAGVLEHLVQPRGFAGAILNLSLAIPRQIPERPDRLGRHEACFEQPRFQQLTEPLRVLDVGLSPRDNQHHRLHELRASLPGEVTVTAAYHPLCGERLAVEGRRRVHGVPCLILRLPDGTPGTIEVQATSAGSAVGEPTAGALLSAEGVRRLRRLLSPGAPGGDGSGT
jgi:hypothetical protein